MGGFHLMILSPLSNRNPKFTSPKVTFFIFVGIVFHNLNSCYIYFHGTVGSAGASVSSFWIFGTSHFMISVLRQNHSFCNGLKANPNLKHLRDCHFMMFYNAKLMIFTIDGRKNIKWSTSTLWFIFYKSVGFYSSREKNHKVGMRFKETILSFFFKNHPTLWFFSRLL